MGYLHINNLYKAQDILLFKECWALEKVHGTSAHISWGENTINFFSGGEKYNKFITLFNKDKLTDFFNNYFKDKKITIFGEAYGGTQQHMGQTYGPNLKFIVFDVKIQDKWISVPEADKITQELGLEFVPYNKISTNLEILDYERDRPSEVSVRRGCGSNLREGIILRPLVELIKNDGARIICKHKGDAFKETRTKREIISPEQLKILEEAQEIAEEWVTEMRLTHILQKFPQNINMTYTREIINAMVEDITRESIGEVANLANAIKAISSKTAKMLKERLTTNVNQ